MTYIDGLSQATIDVIRRFAGAQSSQGDFTASTVTLLSGVLCDVQPVSGKILRTRGGEAVSCDYRAFLAEYPGVQLEPNDILIHAGKELEVESVLDWKGHVELLLSRRVKKT